MSRAARSGLRESLLLVRDAATVRARGAGELVATASAQDPPDSASSKRALASSDSVASIARA
jgi:hypothetical protein